MTRDLRAVLRAARERLVEGPATVGPDRSALSEAVRQTAPLLDGAAFEATVNHFDAHVHGLGALDPLLDDPSVTEVMVNGGGAVWVERSGSLARTDVVLDEPEVLQLIERVVAPLGRHVDRLHPVVDGRLADGSRVHAVVRPLAVDGPSLTIRRFATKQIPLRAMCSVVVAELLTHAVRSRSNILVSGGSSAGKTTLLNALAAEIPDSERVITVEDAAELRLPGSHVVRLESRPANAEGIGEVRVRDLVRSALRMRPDRIVVGEIRGGEAVDMLQAMNTGHDGSLSTCHANSPLDALRRVETLVLMGDVELPLAAIREQVVSAIDLVVQMARRADGARAVVHVAEVEPRPADDGTVRIHTVVDGPRVVGRAHRLPRAPAAETAP
jgi:pilus assembly protein CpaF